MGGALEANLCSGPQPPPKQRAYAIQRVYELVQKATQRTHHCARSAIVVRARIVSSSGHTIPTSDTEALLDVQRAPMGREVLGYMLEGKSGTFPLAGDFDGIVFLPHISAAMVDD